MKFLPLLLLVISIFLIPLTYSVNAQQNNLNKTEKSSANLNLKGDQWVNVDQINNNTITTSKVGKTTQSQVFRSAFDTYVISKPEGYGVYQEKASNVFRPGEPIILYIEPIGYKYQNLTDDKGNKFYVMDFSANSVISYENGNELTSQQGLPDGHIESHHTNKEMYLPFTITQNNPFPQGNYNIKYTIHDAVNKSKAETVWSIPFHICS